MNLTRLKGILKELGVRPRKGLSQNFLIDQNIVAKLLEAAAVSADDYVLEIGPGPGAITEALIAKEAEVVAVELDTIFANALRRLPITVFNADILTFPLEKLKKPTKVVANLPYHITAPILTRFVPMHDRFSSLTVIVQEEVARRITASPGTGDYSSLTIFLNFYATCEYAFPISRSCFYPAPRVDSAVITLTPKKPPLLAPERFFQLVRTAFQQRRKMLKKTIAPLYGAEKVVAAFETIGLDLKVRPEELSLDTFLELYKELT